MERKRETESETEGEKKRSSTSSLHFTQEYTMTTTTTVFVLFKLHIEMFHSKSTRDFCQSGYYYMHTHRHTLHTAKVVVVVMYMNAWAPECVWLCVDVE